MKQISSVLPLILSFQWTFLSFNSYNWNIYIPFGCDMPCAEIEDKISLESFNIAIKATACEKRHIWLKQLEYVNGAEQQKTKILQKITNFTHHSQ